MTEMSACHLCQGDLSEIGAFASLHRVTSDCRPWPAGGRLAVCRSCATLQKVVDAAWHAEAAAIYGGYRIYHQADGAEQAVFAGDQPYPRSEVILRHAFRHLPAIPAGRALDVGCGNGCLLRSFSRLMPNWRLSGLDISEAYRPTVERIAGVEAYYAGDIDAVAGRFDIITLVHTLEHVVDPLPFLRKIKTKLHNHGVLLCEVPNFQQNPFDLLIADHATHFSPETLSALLVQAGFEVETLSADWVHKEISLLARLGSPPRPEPCSPAAAAAAAERNVQWLWAIRQEAAALARSEPIAIFGTSIAATWLFGYVAEAVAAFLDEDPQRVGRTHLGRPILAPHQASADLLVYVPLAPTVAAAVTARLGQGRRYRMAAG